MVEWAMYRTNVLKRPVRERCGSPIIFLIGAGASVDAGMPVVAQLTEALRQRLPDVHDINGKRRAEFSDLFDALAEYDPEVRSNYERFFEWLAFLCEGQTGSFGEVVTFKLDKRLIDAVPDLRWSIKRPIWEIMRSRHQCSTYQPGYFSRLGSFVSKRGRLKVFTTNYDLCIEDACRSQGIDVITGFHPRTGQWSPSLFRSRAPGINLYKLHGSLNWELGSGLGGLGNFPLVEHYPPHWDKVPELILGPGTKLQPDDPYATLYAEFQRAIRQAKVCVAIGYSFRDNHVENPVRYASHRGVTVIDVNKGFNRCGFDHYLKLPMRAKDALELGKILEAVK